MNEFHQREEALRRAGAQNEGLSLVTTGDTFALVRCVATLDEIEAFLSIDDSCEAEYHCAGERKLLNQVAMLDARCSRLNSK